MVAEDYKVQSGSTSKVSDTNLSEEEKAKLEQKHVEQQTIARNNLLTASISGSKEDLEKQYQTIKYEKSSLQSVFNELHQNVQGTLHPNYTIALQKRAKAGFNKLGKHDVFQASTGLYKTFQTAYNNLRTTGSLGGVNIGTTSISDINQLTNYVSNKQLLYGKQNQIDSEKYDVAVQEFQDANNNVGTADRILSDAIDTERALVNEMKFKDNQLRNISIAQGYLA